MNDFYKGIGFSTAASLGAALYLIPYKMAAETVATSVLVLAMLLVAALLNTLTLPVEYRRQAPPVDRRTTLLAAVSMSLLTLGGNAAMALALQKIGPAIASVLLRTEVIFVAIIGFLWLKEAVTRRFSAGCILALVGFYVIKIPGQSGTGVNLEGMLWTVLAAVCFALMQVITRRVIRQIRPVMVNALRLWLSVAGLAVFPATLGGLRGIALPSWIQISTAALAGPTFSRICLMFAARHIPAAYTILVTMISPLFALVIEMLVLGTMPSPAAIAGGLIMLTGIALPVMELARRV